MACTARRVGRLVFEERCRLARGEGTVQVVKKPAGEGDSPHPFF